MILFERDVAAGEAKKRRELQEALTAIHRYEQTQKVSHRRAALQAIQLCSLAESSATRLPALLRLIEFSSPEIFWPALMASGTTHGRSFTNDCQFDVGTGFGCST
jgi:hypothetical protein